MYENILFGQILVNKMDGYIDCGYNTTFSNA